MMRLQLTTFQFSLRTIALKQSSVKGPILYPLSELYVSSQTPVEQHCIINYPKQKDTKL